MPRNVGRMLRLITPVLLVAAMSSAASRAAEAEVFDQRPGVTCTSEHDPRFAEEMTDLMRIAVNVGTRDFGGERRLPGVAFYDHVTRTECYTTKSVQYETGSMVKALMMAVLMRRPEGITEAQKPLIEAAVGRSTNPEAITLWRQLGCGPDDQGNVLPCAEVREFLAAAGMNDTYLAEDGSFGDTHITAYDAVQLFKLFTSPNPLISAERREYALDLLSRTTPRYGVPSYAPADTVKRVKIGHKKNNDDPNQWIANAVGHVEGGPAGYSYLMSIFTNWNREFEIPGWPYDKPSNGPARVNRIGEQINCGVRELNGDTSCWSYKAEGCLFAPPSPHCSTTHPLRSHRSQHWVRVSIRVKLGMTTHWKVMDAANGIVVDEGDAVGGANCACEKTIYGLYGSYVLLLDTNVVDGAFGGSILNYTGDPQPGSNQPPIVRAGPDVVGQEGWPVDLIGFVNDDQGLPAFHWTASPVQDVDPGAACTFDPPNALITKITCTDDGTYALHLSANDGSNDTVTDTARLTLWNIAPALGSTGVARSTAAADSPSPWQPFRVGTSVPLSTTFRDLGSNDTHTCTITWDDGTTQTVQAQDHTCAATHTFTEPGMYTINTKIADDDGDSITSTVMIVVYDPDGGFATGGTQTNSPAGAVTAAPDAAGSLSLQLNPKYHPHDQGPAPTQGKVKAALAEAPFALASTTFDWLVVTPQGKVAVKGAAQINGEDGYGFIVYGYDDPDKLRLVVWPLSEGSYPTATITYDNRRGAPFDLDEADPQPLDSGSFQAHH